MITCLQPVLSKLFKGWAFYLLPDCLLEWQNYRIKFSFVGFLVLKKFLLSEYYNTWALRPRLFLNSNFSGIGIGIVIEFAKLRYWYWYWYWCSKSGVLILILVSISDIWNIDNDIGIVKWSSRIKYWYCLIQAGIAHLCYRANTWVTAYLLL